MRNWATRSVTVVFYAVVSVLWVLPGCGGTTCSTLCEETKNRCPEKVHQPDAPCDELCRPSECQVEELGCLEEQKKFYEKCPYDPCATDVTAQVSSCPAYGEYSDCYKRSYNSKTPQELQQIYEKCY